MKNKNIDNLIKVNLFFWFKDIEDLDILKNKLLKVSYRFIKQPNIIYLSDSFGYEIEILINMKKLKKLQKILKAYKSNLTSCIGCVDI